MNKENVKQLLSMLAVTALSAAVHAYVHKKVTDKLNEKDKSKN